MIRLLLLVFFCSFLLIKVTEKYEQKGYKELTERLSGLGMRFPTIFLSQVYLETGNFTSRIYKENNNMMGMKLPFYRESLAIGENLGHAVYENTGDCILDYIKWQEYWLPRYEENNGKLETDEDYLAFLNAIGYAEDKKYLDKIRNINKTVRKKLNLN